MEDPEEEDGFHRGTPQPTLREIFQIVLPSRLIQLRAK